MPIQAIENFDPSKIPDPDDSVNFHDHAYYVFSHLGGVVIPGFNAGLAWTENLLANFSEAIDVDATDPNNLIVTTGMDLPTLVAGMFFDLAIPATNTGPVTFTFDGLSAVDAKTPSGHALPPGYMRTTRPMRCYLDGTDLIVFPPPATEHIERVTFSGDASYEFTRTNASLYDDYLIRLHQVAPATDNVTLAARLSDDGGVTFKSGGADYTSNSYLDYGPSRTQSSFGTSTSFAYVARRLYNGAEFGINADVLISSPHDAAKRTRIDTIGTYLDTATFDGDFRAHGYRTALETHDAFQIFMSGGNIGSGFADIYGITR